MLNLSKNLKPSCKPLKKTQCHNREHVWLLVRENRDTMRVRSDERYSDAPDTSTGDRMVAQEAALDTPILMLFRQNGNKEDGWRGSPFWWPVLLAPKNTPTAIFAGKLAK